jgi:hypothetical protein
MTLKPTLSEISEFLQDLPLWIKGALASLGICPLPIVEALPLNCCFGSSSESPLLSFQGSIDQDPIPNVCVV